MKKGVLSLLVILWLPMWAKTVSSSSVAATDRPKESEATLVETLPAPIANKVHRLEKAIQSKSQKELLTALFPPSELELLLAESSNFLAEKNSKPDTASQPSSSHQFPTIDRDRLFPKTQDLQNLTIAHPAPDTERVASVFGYRIRPYTRRWQMHNGIDYGAPLGSTVVAAEDGIVTKVVSGCLDFRQRWCGSQFGNWIEIDHGNGVVTTYAHLLKGSITVEEGTRVWRDQEIAQVGSSGWSTGAHLDFRIKIDKEYKDPALYVEK